ncbi:MAG: type II secretion system F family protein [Desulfobacterales bacterium]
MDIRVVIIGILIFFSAILAIWGLYSILDTYRRKDTRRRLETVSREARSEKISIIRTTALSAIPWLNRLLLSAPKLKDIDTILKQAGIRLPLGFFVLLSLSFAFLGFFVGRLIASDLIFGLLGAGFSGVLPAFYVLRKKKKRMQLFTKQLPDALELLGRSLKAGHSFPSGIKLVAHELPDPVGTEFGKVFAEINYGLSVPDALKNLTKRVDSEDLRFFVVSAVIQRETGGNLAEMMDNIGRLIRERFRLLGKVKALAAEGVASAWVLSVIPFGVAFLFYVIRRDYILILARDPWGKILSLVALVWLFFGICIMRKIIRIKI